MTASKSFVLALLVAALATPAIAKPDAKADTNLSKPFHAAYARLNQAWMNKNIDGFMAVYAPDYVGVDVDKNVSNADSLRQAILFMFGEDRFMHATTTISSSRPWKKGVVVVAQTLMKYDTDGGTLHMKVIETDEDYWIKSGGAWKLKQEQELSVYTWHNGKPYEK